VAHNCLREYRRGQRIAEQLPLELEDAQLLPDARLLLAERFQALHRAIRQLPADQREALALHFLVGLRTREVAEALCRSEDAAKMLVQRALEGLRRNPSSEDWR
jgi:RNA polymerase sigma-70 factor, ECF subfamily